MSDYENPGEPRIKGYNPYTGEPIYEDAAPESSTTSTIGAASAPTEPIAASYSASSTAQVQQPAAQTQQYSAPAHAQSSTQAQPTATYAYTNYAQANTARPVYTNNAQYTAAAPAQTKPAKKQGGGAKSFFLSFLGAALACVIALVAYTAITGGFSGKTTTSLGSADSSTIMVDGEDTTLAEAVAAKTTPSVCCIYVYTQSSSNSLYGYLYGNGSGSNSNSSSLVESSVGSGVILSADGYVLTNYHVIEDAAALKVSAGGAEYDATVVGTDASSDLAVIKLTNASGLTPIEIGDSDSLITGQWVMSIGSPFGLESSVATGIVSATSRSQIYSESSSSYYGTSGGTTMVYVNMIQTDAAINPGNSGGALVDANGKLIGINTLITSYSGNYSGVGFAIPVNYAMNIAEQLMNGQTPSHAQLGVSLVSVTSTLAQRYNLSVSSGAYISAVSANTGAAEAGLQVGDIVTKVDDTTVSSASDLMIAVRKHSVGDKVSVTYNRSGTESTVEVTLGSDTDTSSAVLQQNSGSSTGA